MYQFLERSTGNVVGIKLSGKLTHAEYKELVPLIEDRIERFEKIRLLLEFQDFEGWGMHAALDDIMFAYRNHGAVERLALVLDTKADEWALLVDQPFGRMVAGKEKVFSASKFEEAWKWVEKAKTTLLNVDPVAYQEPVRYGPDMSVLIAGGGISGLTLAALLERRGFKPTIVEYHPDYTPSGHNLTLWPSASNVFKGVGLYSQIEARSTRLEHYRVFDKQGRPLHDYETKSLEDAFGPIFSIYRPDLVDILRNSLKTTEFRMGTDIERFDQANDSVNVHFSDKSSERFDLVLGCEGVRSPLRKLLFGKARTCQVPMHTWGFWADPKSITSSGIQEYWSRGCLLGLYPSPERLFCFVGLRAGLLPEDIKGREAEAAIRNLFGCFSGDVPSVLNSMKDVKSIRYGDFEHLDMDQWYRGRVLLLGEVGHAALTAGGMGASLALESVSVLAGELGRTDSRFIDTALSHFVKRRTNRLQSIQQLARHYGCLTRMDPSLKLSLRDQAARLFIKNPFESFWSSVLSAPL